MAKQSEAEAALARFEQQHAVTLRRGGCRVCESENREVYELAWKRGYSYASIIALAKSHGEEMTQGKLAYHLKQHGEKKA